MTNPPEAARPALDSLKAIVLAWNRFWFNPADPTTLGFVRICAGLMVFYIHLSYSFDLEALLSRDAWLDLATVDMLRHEQPLVPPFSGWEEAPGLQPQTAEERAYALKWGSNPKRVVARGQYLWSIWFHV